jgi:hypothetical protein
VKRTRVKPVSDKRRRENKERAAMMEEKYGPRPWECQFHDFTTARDADLMHRVADLGGLNCHGDVNGHEIVKASAWRAGRLEPTNVATLCNFHNGWIEDHPIEARQLGLSKRKEL